MNIHRLTVRRAARLRDQQQQPVLWRINVAFELVPVRHRLALENQHKRKLRLQGAISIENSANQAVTTSRLGLIFRAHGDLPRELPARWRTIPWKTE